MSLSGTCRKNSLPMVDRSNLFFFLQFEIRRSTSSIVPFCPLSARVHASILSLYSTDCCSAPLTSLSFRQDCPRLRLGLPLLKDDQPASFFIFFPTVTTLLYFPRILGSPFKFVSTELNPAAASSINITYNVKTAASSYLCPSLLALQLHYGTIKAGGIE